MASYDEISNCEGFLVPQTAGLLPMDKALEGVMGS